MSVRYLVRLEGEKHAGWQARVYPRGSRHRRPMPYRSRYFSDAAHGGPRPAQRKAATWLRRWRSR